MIDYQEELEQYKERIDELATQKRYAELRDLFLPMEPADIALLLEEGKQEQMPLLYRLLPKETAAEVFVELEPESQEMLINGFSNTELTEVLDELYLDDAVDIVEEMPASVVIRILDKATPEMRKSINEILKYPEDSAGSIMNMEFLSLKKDMTVEDAFKRIRRIGGELETINILYVTDPTRHLLGVLSVRDLLLAEEDDLIEEIMDPDVVWAKTTDDKEDVAQALSKYDFLAMPIVDLEKRLVGIVTVDDAMDVIEEETTEDFEKMAAMLPSDKPYLRTGVFATWKARLPWLMVLMLSATFTGMILNHYENALAACLVLNAYIPMLSGTGGNSGTQASVAVIRALSLDEVDFSDVFRVLWKELRVSLLCGVCLAGANFVKMLLVDRLLLGNTALSPLIAAVVCGTLVCTVLCAKFVGCTLPLLAKKVGLEIQIETGELEDTHPNTAEITLTAADGEKVSLRGSSIGGGNILITRVNGMEVALTGQNPALIVLHKDAPGTIAAVTELMAEYGVNICNFHLARETKGGVAVMTIESDSHFVPELNEKINRLENIYSSTMLERV